jgi:hypothetical protein
VRIRIVVLDDGLNVVLSLPGKIIVRRSRDVVPAGIRQVPRDLIEIKRKGRKETRSKGLTIIMFLALRDSSPRCQIYRAPWTGKEAGGYIEADRCVLA